MLWIGDITYWAGWPERTIETVLNTQRMSRIRDLTTLAVTKTQFLYSEWQSHRTGDLRVVEVDDYISVIKADMDTVPPHDYFDITVYPNDDINETPVEYTFRVEDIDRCIEADQDLYPGCAWLWQVHNETKRKRYLITMLPQTFVDLVDTGTTTTTTTTTTAEGPQ